MPGTDSRQKLENMIAEYNSYLAGIMPKSDSEKLISLIDPEVYLPSKDTENDKRTMMSSLHSLEVMKNNLLTVESVVFDKIVKQ
jgi:hypothetical protein